jgi:hypothetical protein
MIVITATNIALIPDYTDIIANIDPYIIANIDPDIILFTFNTVDPKYKYVRYNKQRVAIELSDTEVISNDGIYEQILYFKNSGCKKCFKYYTDSAHNIVTTCRQLISEGKIIADCKLSNTVATR